MDLTHYTHKPGALLAEIGFAGAQYGLLEPAYDIAQTMTRDEKSRAAGTLLIGIIALAERQIEQAKLIFKSVQDNPLYATFHEEAKTLEAIANQQ